MSLRNVTALSRAVAASPTAAGGGSESATAAASSNHSRESRGDTQTHERTHTASLDAHASTAAQQQLWSSLKLDPLLISHATGLHRVLHDVRHLRDSFDRFSSHLLHMTKTGAGLTAHLQSLYSPETCPPSIRMMATSHATMNAIGVDWFSSKFKNSVLNSFTDWIEDAEAVLSELGLVQKTRHELDGLQDEVEKLFTKKVEAPVWDAIAEQSLQRRLENSKEKLAAACIIYDGQRRGVEKSMKFLLDQRAQLFHSVVSAFMEYEHRFFRDFNAHAAAFVCAYPFSPEPPNLDFSVDPFASTSGSIDSAHSASALLLSMPYFAWDGGRSGIEEGPSVRAIRRSMAARGHTEETTEAKRESIDPIIRPIQHRTAVADVPHSGDVSDPAGSAAVDSDVAPPVEDTRPLAHQAEAKWEAEAKSWMKTNYVASAAAMAEQRELRQPITEIRSPKEKELAQAALALSDQLQQAATSPTKTLEYPDASVGRVDIDDDDADVEEIKLAPPVRGADSSSDCASDGESDEVFVSPEPIGAAAPANSRTPDELNGDDDATMGELIPAASEEEMLQQVEAQATAAAALNLPAKLLHLPRPHSKMTPAMWSSISPRRVRGSIWSTILIEHLEFDNDTDEMREKYSLTQTVAPIYENAFATDTTFERFREQAKEQAQRSEMEWKVKLAEAATHTQTNPHPGSTHRSASSDRFAHMKTVDGSLYVPPSPSSACPVVSFTGAPYPGFSSKQWYLTWQVFTRLLQPLTPDQVIEAIYKIDDKILTPGRVAAIINIWPNEQQMAGILQTSRPTPLTPVESLLSLLSLSVTPSLKSRLDTLHFQLEFGPVCHQVESVLDTLERTVGEIKKSVSLRTVLAVILNLGNFSNSSHLIAPAYGFELDWLTQLRKVRMSDSASTLLDFLVYYLSTAYPNLSFASFNTGAFPHLTQALRVDEFKLKMMMEYIGEEYAKVKKMADQDEYERQNRSVSRSGIRSPLPFPISSFPPRVARFLSYMQSRTTVIRHKYAKVHADIIQLCKYLCVRPETSVEPHLAPSRTQATSLNGDRVDFTSDIGFTNLTPIGEISQSNPPSSSSSSRSRYPWQSVLKILHTFIGEFALAASDYQVSIRIHQAKRQ